MTNFNYMPRPVYATGIKFETREKADRYIDLRVLKIAGNVTGYKCRDCDSIFVEFEVDSDKLKCPQCAYPLREIMDIEKELKESYDESV